MTDEPPNSETIHHAGEVFKLAAILDDRVAAPDKARIFAWANQLQRHRFSRDDLLDGLQAFYDSPSERAIQIGDLIHHARIVKRNRIDKEADRDRDERRSDADAKAADDMRALSAAFISGRVNDTPRLKAARNALDDCHGKSEAQAAIREYFAAKLEARKAKVPS